MFNLTINAVPASTIIVGRRATWLDRHAAEELRDYVKKISGTILNIADETLTMAVTGNRILIGRPSTSDLVKNFADQNPGILPAESDTENDCLAIVQRGEVLVLSGSNDRSVYYSVCHLLQTVFHVGFYWDRDVYEANPDMTVPDNLTIVERSAFKFRHTIGQWVYNHGAFLNEAERREELDKYARNKINSYRLYSWNSYARKMTFIKLGVPGIEIKPEDIARRDIIRDTIEYAQALGIDIMVTLPPDEMTQDFHKLYPNARYFGSEWVKDDNAAPQTKPCLYPEDPMFKTFFQTFVKVWIEEYGPVHNFVASPPCESHISTTIDDYINISVNYSKYTYEAVHELVPEARVFFDGYQAARLCGLNMLRTIQAYIGSLDRVDYFVKALGLVNSAGDFYNMPAVMNGYSDLMVEIFGHRGQHARAAMGAYVLPGNMPVSVDAIVKIRR